MAYSFYCFLPIVCAFVLSVIFMKILLPMLIKAKCGQYIREVGPESHQKKAGTPTMGGLSFLLAFGVLGGVYAFFDPSILPVLLLTLAFGIIGFIDDFKKIVLKHNEGLTPGQKFILQLIASTAFALYYYFSGGNTHLVVSFFGKQLINWDMGIFYILFIILFTTAFSNGTNFTDGLDGLLSTITVVVCAFFVIFTWRISQGLALMSSLMLGVLLGFLCFNCYPARAFMGDTGSLAIGGFVSAVAIMSGEPLVLLLAGFIYVAEVLSVMIQVGYFKYTKKKTGTGKRIFRMSPIHHHYELGGWHEVKVVVIFTMVTVLCCAAALILHAF